MPHPVIESAENALKATLRCEGNMELLDRSGRRALLVSRAEGLPAPSTSWIVKSITATQAIALDGEILVGGASRVAWDLALWHCRKMSGAAIVALIDASQCEALSALMPPDALLVWPQQTELPRAQRAPLMQLRDALVGCLADAAHLIDVRPGGNMERVAADMRLRGCPIHEWIATGDQSLSIPRAAPAPTLAAASNPAQISFSGRLSHFTREPNGAWPGESRAEYLEWLSSTPEFEPRDAFAALRRILAERRIRACGRLISGGTPMVCFTSAEPTAILAQRRWRKGLRRWSFSSYAISFLVDDLAQFGARPVQYAPREQIQLSARDDQCFMQIAESSGEAWQREAEWRVRGDIDFSHIDRERMVALVSNSVEAAHIESEFGIRALAAAVC